MKHIKKSMVILCLLPIMAFLSGCWNYREIEKFAIVSGIAIDKKEYKYLVTTETLEMKGGKDTKISTKLLSSEGISVFDAVRNSIKLSGKKLYFSHAKVLIVSKDIAQEGLIPVIDWVNRDAEPRYTMNILVSKEKTAKEILVKQDETTDILSFNLNDMLAAEKSLAHAPKVEVWNFINDISGKGISAILPTVHMTIDGDKMIPEIEGTGVFKGNKLVVYLDGKETEALLFIKNKISGGLLTQKEFLNNSSANVSLEILKNETKLKPRYSDGKIAMEIATRTDVTIGENGGTADFIDEEGRKKIKIDFENNLEAQIKNLVKKVQKDYDSDIFGFGKTVNINNPDLWKKIEPEWEQIFRRVDVEVHSTINIKNSAYASKPIKTGD